MWGFVEIQALMLPSSPNSKAVGVFEALSRLRASYFYLTFISSRKNAIKFHIPIFIAVFNLLI